MAEGGATYTVNIELATRQFSQDLRNLKNKIQTDLGKAVKIGGKQGTTTQQRAQKLREKRIEAEEARKRFYNADKINAFRVRQGRATAENNKLSKIGLDVEKRQKDIGAAMEAAEKGRFQFAEAKLKVANEQIAKDFKDLDLINKQVEAEKKLVAETNKKAAAEKKVQDRAKKVADAKKTEADARRVERLANRAEARENRQRRGPQGIRMHGPVDSYGNPIYQKGPTVPKSGASLPVDLGRKTTGTFATSHTRLLRRRQNLETLLSTFEGISSPEITNFKKGIQGLVKQYGVVSTSMGQTRNAADFGNAGEIGRQLKDLDNLTHREEQRAKRIQVTNKQQVEFLNKKHRIEKLLATFDKKGVSTDAKRLRLEKAVTVQDKKQLDTLLKEIELESIGLKGVRGTKGEGVSRVSNTTRAASTSRRGTGRGGRMAQSALISGGFPLLFGQSPLIAGFGAAGGAIGEAITPGGGFAGGIAATAISTTIATAVNGVNELGSALVDPAKNIDKLVTTLARFDKGIASSVAILQSAGLTQSAGQLAKAKFGIRYGAAGSEDLEELNKSFKDFGRIAGDLGTQLAILAAGPLTGFMEILNFVLGGGGEISGDKDLGQTLTDTIREREKAIEKIQALEESIASKAGQRELDSVSIYGDKETTKRLREQGKLMEKQSRYRRLGAEIQQEKVQLDALKENVTNYDKVVKFTRLQQKILKENEVSLKEQLLIEQNRFDLSDKQLVKIQEAGKIKAAEFKLEKEKAELESIRDKASKVELERQEQKVVNTQLELDLVKQIAENRLKEADYVQGQIIKLNKEIMKLEDSGYRVVEMSKAIGSSFSESFKGIIQGTMSVQEAFANMFNRIADHFLDMAARMAAAQLQKGILSLFNLGSNPLGALPFDSTSSTFPTNVGELSLTNAIKLGGNYAYGGRPPKGRASLVGERGPELFVPDSAGTIIPNHAMGGANVVVNVDASGSSVEGDAGQAEQLGSMLAAAVQSEIANQQRPGGLLAGTR